MFSRFLAKHKSGVRMGQMRMRLAVLLLSGLVLTSSKVCGQYWVEVGVKKALIERIDVEISSQIRLRSRLSELYWYRTEVGPVYHFEEWISVGLFLENREEWEDAEWHGLNSFGLFGRLSGKYGWLSVMDVNRLDREGLKSWRYRNLLAMVGKSHVLLEKTGYYGEEGLTYRIAPCLENEMFFSVTDNKLDENHLFVGALFEITPFANFKLGCMLFTEAEKNEWQNQIVVMTAMQLTFLQLE